MNAADAIKRVDENLDRLETRLKIDKHTLDEELQDQAHYYNDCAQINSDAISYRDEAKADFDGIKAKVDQIVRRDAAGEPKKPTEDDLKSRTIIHPEYQNAQALLASWNDRVNRLTGLQEAIKQRGYALANLTSLYSAGYWADQAGSSRAGREVRHEHAEEARGALAAKERARQEAAGGPGGRRKLPEDA